MKSILLVATGGTIASTEDGHGLSPALTGTDLAHAVPEVAGLARLDVVQPMNIDSTNMRPADWLRIRDAVMAGYDDHDGFIVLHGTDTMAYTAAALSYLIQDSPKPIVLTGSQRPMAAPFTDARLNLYQSTLWATDPRARDVSIVFGGKVIAGTRARKQRTVSSNAFTSVNYPALAQIRFDRVFPGAALTVPTGHSTLPLEPAHTASEHPTVYDALDARVCTLRLTPGLTPHVFDLLAPDYDGIILETFGMGGVPEYADASGESYREAVFRWVDSGRALVMTTQVPEEGLDLGVYEVGRAYAEHPGILKGGDMTTEALVAKTMWALGQTHDPEEFAHLFYLPVNHDRTES